MTAARDLGPVDYTGVTAPPLKYRCDECNASGCKLWREYQTFLAHQVVRCAECAGKHEQLSIATLNAAGRSVLGRDYGDTRTDQIGGLIPAVPTKEGDTYWGYTSVPEEGVLWWIRLPSRPAR